MKAVSHYLWKHFANVVDLFPDLPHLVPRFRIPVPQLFYCSLNVGNCFVDLPFLVFYRQFHGSRFGLDFLQQRLCSIELCRESVAVLFVGGGSWRLEMREQIFLSRETGWEVCGQYMRKRWRGKCALWRAP